MDDVKQIVEQKLARLKAAISLEDVDRVPLVGLGGFWPVGYSRTYTMQDAYYSMDVLADCYKQALSEWNQWDALNANMQPLGPLLDATGSKRYNVPGRDLSPDAEFQHPDLTLMSADEYGPLIDNPVKFLVDAIIPRLCSRAGSDDAYERTTALAKASAYLSQLATKRRTYAAVFRDEFGIPLLFQGQAFTVPLDLIADRLRGFHQGILDVKERPQEVQSACEALVPFIRDVTISSLPAGSDYPLLFNPQHVSPFLSPRDYDRVYWPTFKKLVDAFVERGHRIWAFFEDRQDQHLERLQDLPKGKVVAHLESTDLAKAKKALGGRLCVAGGMPIKLLSRGSPQEVREQAVAVLKLFEDEPGYIMTTDAALPPNAKPENIHAWVDTVKEYSSRGGSVGQSTGSIGTLASSEKARPRKGLASPGVKVPYRKWDDVKAEFGKIEGSERVIAERWEELERLALPLIYALIS